MGGQRKKRISQFKAKVALAAIQNDETAVQIENRFGGRSTIVSTYKHQMLGAGRHLQQEQQVTQTGESPDRGHSSHDDFI